MILSKFKRLFLCFTPIMISSNESLELTLKNTIQNSYPLYVKRNKIENIYGKQFSGILFSKLFLTLVHTTNDVCTFITSCGHHSLFSNLSKFQILYYIWTFDTLIFFFLLRQGLTMLPTLVVNNRSCYIKH